MTMTHTAPAPVSTDVAPGRARRRAAFALLVSAQFVVMADTAIVNVALPSVQRDLALGAVGAAWVVNSYVLAYGGLLLLFGRVADLVGRRRMFALGSGVFTLGTVIAAVATGPEFLMAGRVVQGIGAAALSPAAMALLLLSAPGERRAAAMSAWGAASTLGGMTGVVAGGLIADHWGWRAVFLVTVPATLMAVVAAPRLLPAGAVGRRRRLDGWGAAALTGAIVALVQAALGAADRGWADPTVGLSVLVAASLLASFIALARRSADPLVPLGMLASRRLSRGLVIAVLGGAARASTFVLLALYLQQGLAMAPAAAGLAMAPTSLVGFGVSVLALPRVLLAFGPARTLIAGLVILAAGHLWLAFASAQIGYAGGVLPGLVLVAAGVALSFTPTTMLIASAVPPADAGLASGMAGSATQVGAALGMASFTAIGLAVGGAVGGAGSGVMSPAGFAAAFVPAAGVALLTALIGSTLTRPAVARSSAS